MTCSNAKAEGRFGKQDFRYVAAEDIYVLSPAGEKLAYHYTTEENGLVLRPLLDQRLPELCNQAHLHHRQGIRPDHLRWEHEHILEAVQRRLDEHPEKMRQRRETVEHPFGIIKGQDGRQCPAFPDEDVLPQRLPPEMALHVLAYNLTRVMNIMEHSAVHPLSSMRA